MRTLYEPLIIMLSVYTRIPMPYTEWNSINLRYAFCFLPFVGLVTGAAAGAWLRTAYMLSITPFFSAAGMCAISALITGGIHLDGFADTVDACGSYAEKEKRLKIMDDPHTGAFGAAGISVYLIFYTAAVYEIITGADITCAVIWSIIFPVLSRSLTAAAVSRIPLAKTEGMLYMMTSAADRRAVGSAAALFMILSLGILFSATPHMAAPAIAVITIIYVYFRRMAVKGFGGLTGDLCGWLIQVSELALMAAAVFTFRIINLF